MAPSSPTPLQHIVICGSMSALAQMELLADQLRQLGFAVTTPVPDEAGLDWAQLSTREAVAVKKAYLSDYFEVIRQADLVLIANFDKNGIAGYVGANTLMEAACGYALRKPVFFLQPLGHQSASLELAAISSGVLDGDPGRLPELLEGSSG